MNCAAYLSLFLVVVSSTFVMQADANPLSKTVELLNSLAAKVTAEGKAEATAYEAYEQWCEGAESNLKNDIKTGEAQKESLEATISKTAADIEAADSRIEELAGSITSDEQELAAATVVRGKESADFAASEAELVDAIEVLDRAVMILQKEMRKNPAALAQLDSSNVDQLIKSLDTVIDAASFPVTDQKKLTALVQAQQSADADDDAAGAPSTAAYKSHSGSIFDILEDLREKAEGQLSDLRKAERNTKHNFQMLRQSLTDQIKVDTESANAAKAAKASTQEAKAVAGGDLAETAKDLENDKSTLGTAAQTCRTVALDHDATVKSRNEELTALETAKRVLSETSSGAVAQTYTFLELKSVSALQTRVDLANAEIISLLKRLAKDNHSAALAQLASRIAATLRYGAAAGQDPFVKVRQLIADMLSKLEAEAQSDLTEKSYCDEELAKSSEKKNELNAEMTKLTAKMDQAAASSAGLKADVKELQATLAKLAKSEAEMSTIRRQSHKDYLAAKSDLALGLAGVRKALRVLRDYYGSADAAGASMIQGSGEFAAMMQQPSAPEVHAKSGDAGASVISALDVVESDFARDLAVEETAEADAEAEYEKTMQANKFTKSIKEDDVKYKTKEFKSLDKTLSDLSGDKGNTGTELDAVLEYYAKLRERCIAKPETYETRKSRRESEISGLKEALSILEGEAVFLQHGKKHDIRKTFLAA